MNFLAQAHPRVDVLAPHMYEETAGLVLRNHIVRACNGQNNSVGQIVGRKVTYLAEKNLINVMQHFQKRVAGDIALAQFNVKANYNELQIDCVSYCNVDQFDFELFRNHPNILPITPSGTVRNLPPLMSFTRYEKKLIKRHEMKPAVDSHGLLMETQDLTKISQTRLAMPVSGGQAFRIIAEICGIGSERYIREKLWQLEKDLVYFAVRDQWRILKQPQQPNISPLNVEEQCSIAEMVFPYNHLCVDVARQILEQHADVFVLLNRMYHSGKLYFVIAPTLNQQVDDLRQDINNVREEIRQEINNVREEFNRKMASMQQTLNQILQEVRRQ